MKKRKVSENTAELVGLPPVEKEFLDFNKTLYYNAEIHNDTFTEVPYYNNNIQATFTDDRAIALLEKSRTYMMAIERFYIPGILIPIFNFDNTNGDYQVNVTVFNTDDSFERRTQALTYGGSSSFSLPPSGETFIYTYTQFLEMTRFAIRTALNYIRATFPAFNWIDENADTPYFTYESNGLITMTSKYDYWNAEANSGTKRMRLYLPYRMAMLFAYMNTDRINTVRSNDVLLWTRVRPIANPFNIITVSGIQYIKTTQEASSSYLWNDLQKIVFLTNTIPVKGEVIKADQGQNVYYNLVTDFEPLFNGDNRISDVFQYFPSGPRRWIDLQNNGPLITLNVTIVWQSKTGKRYPLYIPPGYSCSIKMVFAKRKDVSLE